VDDNEFRTRNLDDFPHFFRRLKASQPNAYTISVVDWAPIHLKIVRDADVSAALVYPKLSANNKVELNYEEGDDMVARRSVRELTDGDPTAMFVYFGQVDETGHQHGFHPTVREYCAAIERVDAFVGNVLEAMKNRKSYPQEDWLVLVSSDHGGKGTGHAHGHKEPEIRNSFLIVSGVAAARGKIESQTYIVDVPVTALTHLGVKIDPAWQLDGKAVGLKEREISH
jgi:predicted AlkP superfamily pyrophosphatase or phosphodiesterase